MADEENNTEATTTGGEPKPVEMSGSVNDTVAPKKKASPKKKAPAKKAPAKKAAAKKTAPAAAAAVAASSATAEAPAARRPSYTPPPKSMWWQALIFIAIALYAFSLIRDAAHNAPTTGDENGSESSQPAVATEQAAKPGNAANMDPRMMPMQPMSPMNNMGSGIGHSMANTMRDGMGFGSAPAMPPQAAPDMPVAPTPQQAPYPQAMPQQPYHGYPQQPYNGYPPQGYYPPRGYPQGPGFYGPGGWYGPGYAMPYPPQPMPNN